MLDAFPREDHAVLDGHPFTVAVHPHRNQVVVAPAGELDLATVEPVERELAELRAAGFDDLVLDLRALTFLDSSGLQLLLTHSRRARDDGYRFRLVASEAQDVRRLFEITGTLHELEFLGGPAVRRL